MSNESNTMLGFIAGAATGALLGVLFAPDKGKKTRKKIAREVKKTQEQLLNEASNIKENVLETYESASKTVEDNLDHLMSNFSDQSEEAITKLEAKLDSLKKKSNELKRSV